MSTIVIPLVIIKKSFCFNTVNGFSRLISRFCGLCVYSQGPLEIALVFLCQGQESNEEGESQMFTRHHHRLRLSFKEFVKRLVNCDTVVRNRIVIFESGKTMLQKAKRSMS